jgi:hypothetical protein
MNSASRKQLAHWDEIYRFEGFLAEGLAFFSDDEYAFSRSFNASSLDIAQAAITVEHSSEVLFSEIIGISNELLFAITGDREILREPSEVTINGLFRHSLISQSLRDSLHQARGGRNELQHVHSLTKSAGVWRRAKELLGATPGIEKALEKGFLQIGIQLPSYLEPNEKGGL